MPFTHEDRKPGDRVRSADWNAVGREVARLEGAKVSREGDTITGALAVRGDLSLGTAAQGAALRVLRAPEDATAPTHGALVLGGGAPDAATLRVGLGPDFSWLQTQGRPALAINPRGGDVGVGTTTPRSRLSVAGGLSVGASWAAAVAAPASSLIVEGSVGIGTPTPTARLSVAGTLGVTSDTTIGGALRFGSQTRQMLNLFGAEYGAGVQGFTTYFRSAAHFAFYRGGAHVDAELNAGGGAALMVLRTTGEVGIGTVAPAHRLEVQGGNDIALFQSSTNNAYVRIATAEGLGNRVEVANRPGGRLALWVGSGVDAVNVLRDGRTGIGTTDPQDRLEVRGGLRILTDGNPVRFTSTWSGFPDGALNQAEISNDTGGYKKLMIIGNKSGGGVRRVGIWDELAVHGQLVVDQDIKLGASRTISAPGRLHISGDELLYVLNRNGMMIGREWGGNGNLVAQGTIGTNGLPATPIHAGWGGGIRTFDIEAEGTIWCRHSVIANGADLAENYACGGDVEPADVVCLDPDRDAVVRSERARDGMVLGVVSTAPGLVLNADLEGEVRPIALSGRVPCKVTDENGPIRRGDLLTSSSTPGHAMRAEPAGGAAYQPGTIVGKALGSLEAGAGTIEVFVLLR